MKINIKHRTTAKNIYKEVEDSEFVISELSFRVTSGILTYFKNIGLLNKMGTTKHRTSGSCVYKWKATPKFKNLYENL